MGEKCNKQNCTCDNINCERHGKCCLCINHHLKEGSLVKCMRNIRNKEK